MAFVGRNFGKKKKKTQIAANATAKGLMHMELESCLCD